jgi:hypothetical protein
MENTLVIGILTLPPKYSIAEPRQNGYGQDHFPDQLVRLTLIVSGYLPALLYSVFHPKIPG